MTRILKAASRILYAVSMAIAAIAFLAWIAGSGDLAFALALLAVVTMMGSSISRSASNIVTVGREIAAPDVAGEAEAGGDKDAR